MLRPAVADPRPRVAAIRSIEVAPGIPQQARLSRPSAAAQLLVSPKPRRRVLAVGIDLEPRVWAEVTRGPFPNVANHLTTAKSAVACRKCVDIHGAHGPPAQVGALRFRRFIAPGQASLSLGKFFSKWRWFGC